MGRTRYIAGFFAIGVGLYFGLTWFFFGSVHPCGILEARQKPYVDNRFSQSWVDTFKLLTKYLKDREQTQAVREHVETRDKQLDDILARHNIRIRRLTPAQCLWRAIAWDPDPYKVRP